MPNYEQVLKHHVHQEDPEREYDLEITTITDRNASVAKLVFHTQKSGVNLYATGSAKRLPGDTHYAHASEQLAVGRALIAMGQHLADQAEESLP